jgi:hypothetical protein
MRRQTWLAIIVCLVLIIPAGYLGWNLAEIYRLAAHYMVGPSSAAWWGRVYAFVVYIAIPNFVEGLVAGGGALFVTGKIFSAANVKVVAYATGGILTILFLTTAGTLIVREGMTLLISRAVVDLIGAWAGLICALIDFQQRAKEETALGWIASLRSQ